MRAERIYAAALRLFPADFRGRFAPEMSGAFAAAVCDRRDAGLVRLVDFLIVEATALALAVGREWIRKLTSDPVVRFRVFPDCRRMRPIGITRAEWAAGLDYVD